MARFSGFDGLRAFAALSVLVTHTAGLTTFNSTNDVLGSITARLNVGVAVFFVISGFLLYRPFYEGTNRPLRSYGRARALRILPAYWFALTVLVIWPGLPNLHPPHGDWWRYYGLTQVYDSIHLATGLGPAWSLCIEVTFYAFLPLFALYRGPALPMIGMLALLSFATRTYMHANHPDVTYSWWLPGTFLWFAGGMAMAVLSVEGRKIDRTWPWWSAAVAVLLALSYLGGLPRTYPYIYTELAWAVEHVGFALFAVLLVAPIALGPGPRWLQWGPIAWLGTISYGIYLWQVPLALKINDWVGDRGPLPYVTITLLTAAATIACAAFSYYFVERPLLRRKAPRGSSRAISVRARPAAAVEPRRSST